MFNFNNFHIQYGVDITRLKRNYEKFPLIKTYKTHYDKDGRVRGAGYVVEDPYKEDLEYLYIELNIPLRDIIQYFDLTMTKFGEIRRRFKLKKDPKKQIANTLDYYQKNYNVSGPGAVTAIKEKIYKTNLKRYGTKVPSQSDVVKEKIKRTNLEKYGFENPLQSKIIQERLQQTNLQRYGVKNPFQAEKIKEKIKYTNLQRYGVENVSSCDSIKEKKKATTLKHYGVENPSFSKDIVDKIFTLRKKHGTVVTSSFEEKAFVLLNEVFDDVRRQYKSEKYPFACDFYIPELDLYIELQGHPSHGKEPYDPNNLKHTRQIEIWSSRAKLKIKKRTQYDSYINVWTKRDPLKREIAKKNKLNWIEFFTFKEFKVWLVNLKK